MRTGQDFPIVGSSGREIILSALVLVALSSCAPITTPLKTSQYPLPQKEGPGYRFATLDGGKDENKLFVWLSFSGGGTRAAALAYGAMLALRQTQINWPHAGKRLLDEVDCISSVSGGSFTAAYYGLFRDELFSSFES